MPFRSVIDFPQNRLRAVAEILVVSEILHFTAILAYHLLV
jgi:hypothetical protein